MGGAHEILPGPLDEFAGLRISDLYLRVSGQPSASEKALNGIVG